MDEEMLPASRYPIEELGGSVWLRELVAEHGMMRSISLIGWAVMLGNQMKDGEKLEAARDRLEARGFEKTTVWRVCRDIRKVAARLDAIYQTRLDEKTVLTSIANLQ